MSSQLDAYLRDSSKTKTVGFSRLLICFSLLAKTLCFIISYILRAYLKIFVFELKLFLAILKYSIPEFNWCVSKDLRKEDSFTFLAAAHCC